jgi:hypothetical protein
MLVPTARWPVLEPEGIFQARGKPWRTALCRAVMTETVLPSRSAAHVSPCPAHTVKAHSSTDLVHAVLSRLVVLFLKKLDGVVSPARSNASRTEILFSTGDSCSLRIMAGAPAMSRWRFCGQPKSAQSNTAQATLVGWSLAYSCRSKRTAGTGTSSRDQPKSPRESTRSIDHLSSSSELCTSGCVAELARARENAWQGGER